MRVGTRNKRLEELAKEGDHPHACGDKLRLVLVISDFAGSSPCVWGQANSVRLADCHSRIIPMRVGTRIAGESL